MRVRRIILSSFFPYGILLPMLGRTIQAFVVGLNKISQVSGLDKLFNLIFQCLTFFGRVFEVAVILTLFGCVKLCIFWRVGIRSAFKASSIIFPLLVLMGYNHGIEVLDFPCTYLFYRT